MNDLFNLKDQVVLVTGATGGLGASIVEAIVQNNARVLVSDINKEACNDSVESLVAQGYKAHAMPCDLRDKTAVDSLVLQAEEQFGQIDVLVCNAGVQGPAAPLTTITDEDWDLVMDVNLKSVLHLSARVIEGMAKRKKGSVIFMSSIAGLRGNKAIGLYGLSKAGLAQLARNLAVEWGPHGIRVNAISPGLINTPLAQGLIKNDDFMARRISLTPLRRVGEPEEIAGVVVMLASQAGGFITGQNLVVDGGTLISDGG